jgi:hypothetical protein
MRDVGHLRGGGVLGRNQTADSKGGCQSKCMSVKGRGYQVSKDPVASGQGLLIASEQELLNVHDCEAYWILCHFLKVS